MIQTIQTALREKGQLHQQQKKREHIQLETNNLH